MSRLTWNGSPEQNSILCDGSAVAVHLPSPDFSPACYGQAQKTQASNVVSLSIKALAYFSANSPYWYLDVIAIFGKFQPPLASPNTGDVLLHFCPRSVSQI